MPQTEKLTYVMVEGRISNVATPDFSSREFPEFATISKAVFYLVATGSADSPSVVVKIQELDESTQTWFDVVTFTTLSGNSTERKELDPVLGNRLRVNVDGTMGGTDALTLNIVCIATA